MSLFLCLLLLKSSLLFFYLLAFLFCYALLFGSLVPAEVGGTARNVDRIRLQL